ncbi:hypothetical protein G6M26_06480 [Agrobacterium tumefaciens]|nr:hypothetical protein [Agrobacterium tumefaciens]NTE18163.1 hypothetical protein [Agrobacterium tumefaciens]
MNRIKNVYCLLLTVLICMYLGKANAQSNTNRPKIIPLTPNAAEFNRYGDYNVNPLTGRPDISIPIYKIISGSLEMPITLSYFAGGIKVNQVATWVGLGWSLNAGGIISRSVRGIPDETFNYGWIADPTTPAQLSQTTDAALIEKYADLSRDAEPDFFSYSTPSSSGKFIFRKTTQAFETIPYRPVKIFRSPGSTDVNNNYQITDENGVNYYYAQKQNYVNDNVRETPQALRFYTQSWYLTKIVSANQKDSIVLKYKINTKSTEIGNGRTTQPEWIAYPSYNRPFYRSGKPDPINYPNGPVFIEKDIIQSSSSIATTEPALTEIIFKNGKIVFNSTTGRKDYPGAMLDDISIYRLDASNIYKQVEKISFNYDYFKSANPISQYDHRLKLNSISKLDSNANLGDIHKFEYNNITLPATLSTAQDYWGYYNGREQGFLPNVPPDIPQLKQWYGNTPLGIADRSADDNLVQAGILQKIIYPTGGYTVFNYESNKYKSEIFEIGTLNVLSARITGIGKRKPLSQSYDFSWPVGMLDNNIGTITIRFSAHTNPGAFDVAQRVLLRDLTTGINVGIWDHPGDFTIPSEITPGYRFDSTHQYRLTLTIDDDSPSKISIDVTGRKKFQSDQIKSGGGLRISKIENYDKPNGLTGVVEYSYKGQNGEGIGNFMRNDSDFLSNYFTRIEWVIDPECLQRYSPCQCLLYQDTWLTFVGQGEIPQVNFAGSVVNYDTVKKMIKGIGSENNGKIVYSSNTKINGESIIYNPNIPGGKEYFDNNMISEGKLPSEAYYSYDKKSGNYKLIKERLYKYDTLFNKISEPALSIYRVIFFPVTCENPSNLLSMGNFRSSPFGVAMGSYKTTRIIERNYDQNGFLSENNMEMFYDNLYHLQPTRTITVNSDLKKMISLNLYPNDYASGTPFIDDMKTINNIGTPIESLFYKESSGQSTIVNGSVTQYLNGGAGLVDRTFTYQSTLPTSLLTFKFSNQPMGSMPFVNQGQGFSKDLNYGERLIYKYDDNHNPVMISIKNGNSICYIWSYNNAYPVAEIKNADYATIESILGGSGAVSSFAASNPTNAEVNSLINTLRNSPILKDAHITSYTYKPLIGMTSMTDPKGMTTYYEYDEFQRLKNMKDQNGNILKNTTYHYKN